MPRSSDAFSCNNKDKVNITDMRYDRTCSASGIFVSNNVMSFNEIWRENMYNFKERVTKGNNFVVSHAYNFTVKKSVKL